jgi:hypothetical protein
LEQQMTAPLSHFTMAACWCHINPRLWQKDIMELLLIFQCVLNFSQHHDVHLLWMH